MDCTSCHATLPQEAVFCPKCGAAASAPEAARPRDRSISAPETLPGAWHWLLLLLLLGERLLALFAFPVDESLWLAAGWERPFLWGWALGLGVPAMGLLALRKRPGGWLAGLSGLALAVRACVPMLSESRSAEQQVYGAVCALLLASGTLTFAFLFEQSYWEKAGPVSELPELE